MTDRPAYGGSVETDTPAEPAVSAIDTATIETETVEGEVEDANAAPVDTAGLAERRVRPMTVGSGTRLANRYRLEEEQRSEDGLGTWRAVDELLRRSVGVHVLPASDPRADAVMSAVQASAKVSDPRFLQVLDASEENGFVYVVQEWLTDGAPLSQSLKKGPLASRDAVRIIDDICQAMATAHAAGLFHRRLGPDNVLRTDAGQAKIAGLELDAAFYSTNSENAAAADTQAIGKLLFAVLTGWWPGPESVGLPNAPSAGGRVVPPGQVKAGIPSELDDVTVRILSEQPPHGAMPLRTPTEIAAALSMVPRSKLRRADEEQAPGGAAGLPPGTTVLTGATNVLPGRATPAAPPPAAPPGRSETADLGLAGPAASATPSSLGSRRLWYGAAALVVALTVVLAIVLTRGGGSNQPNAAPPPPTASPTITAAATTQLQIASAKEFEDDGGQSQPDHAQYAIDGISSGKAWNTAPYDHYPTFGNLRTGAGILVDLGSVRRVHSVQVGLVGDGTNLELRVAPSGVTSPPASSDAYQEVASATNAGSSITLTPNGGTVSAQYLLIWLTSLPSVGSDQYRGGIDQIQVVGN